MGDAIGVGDMLVETALTGSPALSIFKRMASATKSKVRDTLRSRTDAELAKMLTGSPQGLAATLGRRPLLPALPYRGIARGAFQIGRLSGASQ